MRDGEHVVTNDTQAMDRETIIRAMVGRSLSSELYDKRGKSRPRGAKVLSVENLTMGADGSQQFILGVRRAG